MAGLLDQYFGQGNASPINTAAQNFAGNIRGGGGLLSSFLNAAQGYNTGVRTDPAGMFQQMTALTSHLLQQNGVPQPQADLAALNPDAQKQVLGRLFPEYGFEKIGNTIGSTNKYTGGFNPRYVAPEFKTVAPGDQGISYQPPLMGAAPGPMGVPRPAPVQATPLAPPPGVPGQASPTPGAPQVAQGGTQTIVPGMSLQEKEAATERGKLQGQAQANLPKAQATAEQALQLVEQIRTHPGRNVFSTGPLAPFAQYQKGSNQYDFAKLVEQARSGAFLSAFSTLRGGGAISDAEGRKATDAFVRMDAAQTREGFEQSLNDYRNIIQTGLQNQQRIARGEMQPYPTTPIDIKGGVKTAPSAAPAGATTPPAVGEGGWVTLSNGAKIRERK